MQQFDHKFSTARQKRAKVRFFSSHGKAPEVKEGPVLRSLHGSTEIIAQKMLAGARSAWLTSS
jgi:hypothetical protein